jgi:L-alanine-DL-glutamate epimerase-like enolase superfamily enzyme
MVLVVLALLGGAVFAWRRGSRQQAALMLVLAAVMAANVAIWAIPGKDGSAPLGQSPR